MDQIAADDETTNEFRVCGACGYHYRESARAAIVRLVDPESFREQDSGLASTDPLHFVDETAYRERLLALKAETGEADALVSGFARLQGHEVAIAALDFGFLGGSMGVVVGEKLVRIAERARERRVPLISISASGGARMQEGMLSLLQMAKTSAAVQRLRESGCAYISILAHPTTGGVFASFANLGDIILAEPGALIGFAGPRVAEQIIGRKLPEGSHTAEFLYAHGMVDAIIDRREQRDFLARCLAILTAPRTGYPAARALFPLPPERTRRFPPGTPYNARAAPGVSPAWTTSNGCWVSSSSSMAIARPATIQRSSPALAHSMAKPSPSLRWNEVIWKTASAATTAAPIRRGTARRAG